MTTTTDDRAALVAAIRATDHNLARLRPGSVLRQHQLDVRQALAAHLDRIDRNEVTP